MDKQEKRILLYFAIGAILFVVIALYKGATPMLLKKEIKSSAKKVSIVFSMENKKGAGRDNGELSPMLIVNDDICTLVNKLIVPDSIDKLNALFFGDTRDIDLSTESKKRLWSFFKDYVHFEKTGVLPYLVAFEEELEAIKAGLLAGQTFSKRKGMVDFKKAKLAIAELIEKYPNNGLYPIMMHRLLKDMGTSYEDRRIFLLMAMVAPEFYTPEYRIRRAFEREFISSVSRWYAFGMMYGPSVFYANASAIEKMIKDESKEFADKALSFARMLQKKMDHQDGIYTSEAKALYGLSNRIINAINERWGTTHSSKYSYLDAWTVEPPAPFKAEMDEIHKGIDTSFKSGDKELYKEYLRKQRDLYKLIDQYKKDHKLDEAEPEDWENPYEMLKQKECDRTGADREFEEYINERDRPYNFARYLRRYRPNR